MDKPKSAGLKEMLNYEADSYFSPDEISFIQNTFKDPKAIKILRKALLPSIFDPELPIEELGGDVWMQGVEFDQMQAVEVKPIVIGRQMAIKFVVGALIKLKVIANATAETDIEATYRRSKDSVK